MVGYVQYMMDIPILGLRVLAWQVLCICATRTECGVLCPVVSLGGKGMVQEGGGDGDRLVLEPRFVSVAAVCAIVVVLPWITSLEG